MRAVPAAFGAADRLPNVRTIPATIAPFCREPYVLIFADASYRAKSAAILLVGMIVGTIFAMSGIGDRVERLIDPVRVVATIRPPGGQVVLVEMDAASVAAIKRWPWPREHYAAVIDQLRMAGAASITFDVDLSSASTSDGDQAMAAALKRADGGVALPTFAQHDRSGERRSIDSLPLPMFRAHAALTSVSMQPDADGVVRRAPFGTITAGVPRPSLSAYMAHRSGSADTFFPIDFGSDPALLPRVSFVAVEKGRFDPALVQGRDVLIGATAIEMGDRYATPHWGVLPGVVIQALAAETLMSAVPTSAGNTVPIIVALLIGALILAARRRPSLAVATAVAAPILLFVAAITAQRQTATIYPLAAAFALIGVAMLGRIALHLDERFDRQRCIDEDTGLPNQRAMIRDRTGSPATPIVVALVGNFDAVVTLMGERAGHDMILRLADRLRLAAGGRVYRLSDRLLALELAIPTDALAGHIAGLKALLTQPVEILGRRTDAAVHLGMADGAASRSDGLVNATRAATEAHNAGVFWRHSAIDVEAMERRLVLMGELDQAMTNGEIEVHYQPMLALATNRITSVEALVRWRHPVRGMVGPDAFIPLAEQSDRIAPLTLFIIARVIADVAHWRTQGLRLTAAINLSATLIALPTFADAAAELVARRIVPPESLIFEVTESAALSDPERAAATLSGFRDQGVAISMDDYGTGQSTLSYLRQLPLSELKIDRSFVQHAHLNRPDKLMVRSTIDLAHDLGLTVVAEGIEDQGCLDFLREAGCDMAQGYLISRPLQAAALEQLLIEQRRAA